MLFASPTHTFAVSVFASESLLLIIRYMMRIALTLGLAALAGIGGIIANDVPQETPPSAGAQHDTSRAQDTITRVSMSHVNFYIIPQAALRIRTMRGSMRSLNGGPVVFDDKNSFVIHLDYADIGLKGTDITELMNRHIFAYRGSPLKNLKVHTAGNHIVQSGTMHKILDIPFEITADVSVTPEGLLRLHPVRTRILGVNGNDLMRAFHLSLEKILDLSKAKGVTVKGNDIFLDPVKILPPPAIEGHATAIRIENDEIVQTFGTPEAAPPLVPPDTAVPAYMFYKGGTLHFGKLLMLDAQMQIVDSHPSPWFDFSLDRYKEQLVAGYSRTLSDLGLEVYMLGLDKLSSRVGVLTPPADH